MLDAPAAIRTKIICAAGVAALEEGTRTLGAAKAALARGDYNDALARYVECQEIAVFVGELFSKIWAPDMTRRARAAGVEVREIASDDRR